MSQEIGTLVQLSVLGAIEMERLMALILAILVIGALFYKIVVALIWRRPQTDVQAMSADQSRLIRLPRLLDSRPADRLRRN
jgi:hypothetical protein